MQAWFDRISGYGREFVAPVMRDFGAGAEPDIVEAAHVIEKLDQAQAAPGPADQPVMQSDREKFRRSIAALTMQDVKGVAHIREELFSSRKPAVLVEAV